MGERAQTKSLGSGLAGGGFWDQDITRQTLRFADGVRAGDGVVGIAYDVF